MYFFVYLKKYKTIDKAQYNSQKICRGSPLILEDAPMEQFLLNVTANVIAGVLVALIVRYFNE